MAWFEVDIFKKCVEVDLHKYSTNTALAVVREKIREAYDHGFISIKLIHGAANITEMNDRGSIKFRLRFMLKSGELNKWINSGSSKLRDESLIIELKKNPAPENRKWKEIPPEDY